MSAKNVYSAFFSSMVNAISKSGNPGNWGKPAYLRRELTPKIFRLCRSDCITKEASLSSIKKHAGLSFNWPLPSKKIACQNQLRIPHSVVGYLILPTIVKDVADDLAFGMQRVCKVNVIKSLEMKYLVLQNDCEIY